MLLLLLLLMSWLVVMITRMAVVVMVAETVIAETAFVPMRANVAESAAWHTLEAGWRRSTAGQGRE